MLGTILPRGEVVAESRPVVSRIQAIGRSARTCLMVRVDKHYGNDKSAAKECAAVNMLFNQAVIEPGIHPRDGWQMVDRNPIRILVLRS
jgi:hypothetical protein